MWKQKLGMSVANQYSIPTTEVVELLAKIGFDAISPVWNAKVDLTPTLAAAKACGLELQSIHGPFHAVNRMWNTDESVSAPVLKELLRSLEDCNRWEIPVLVSHTWIGFGNEVGDISCGLKNYETLVAKAKEYGVRIALENTEGLSYLKCLMEHFKNDPTVGFCWDSGHEMCYNGFEDLLAEYGNRLYMTHLNDNLGVSRYDGKIYWTDDLHLLPYDGIADWDAIAQRLKNAAKPAALNFELKLASPPNRHENDVYQQMSPVAYFTEAYKRACRVAHRVLQCSME